MAKDPGGSGKSNNGQLDQKYLDNLSLDTSSAIVPLNFMVNEDAPISIAIFAICLESKVLDTNQQRVAKRFQELKLAASYLSRQD